MILEIAVAFRSVLADPAGTVLGGATDTVHHLWGIWHLAQGGRDGVISALVSFPDGELGSLLCPAWHQLGALLFRVGGIGLAYNLSIAVYLAFDALAAGLWAGRLARSPVAGAVAAGAVLVGRPLFTSLGGGVVEGLAVGWIALAGWFATGWARGRARDAAGMGLAAAIAVIENPYAVAIAPVLLAGATLVALRRGGGWRAGGRRGLGATALAAVCCVLPLAVRAWAVSGALGGNAGAGKPYLWEGRLWRVFIVPHAFEWRGIVLPMERVDHAVVAQASTGAPGTYFLGLVPLALALAGAARSGAGRWALAASLACLALAAGPFPFDGGPPGPFQALDVLLAHVAVPLTQPQRFLGFAQLFVAIGAGVGAVALGRFGAVALVALAAEALTLGGPAWRPATLRVDEFSCLAALAGIEAGAVHVVGPRDWSRERVTATAELMQIQHGLPGTHRSIGGWTAQGDNSALTTILAELAEVARAGSSGREASLAATARAAGIAWIVIPGQWMRWAPGDRGPSCGSFAAYRLPGAPSARR